MGVLSDIVIARPDEASSINAAGGAHEQQWPTLASKGIDTIKLGTLSHILARRRVDDVNTVASFMLDAVVDEASEDGPWVYRVPDDLTAKVAALDEATGDRVAREWAAPSVLGVPRQLLLAGAAELVGSAMRPSSPAFWTAAQTMMHR